MPRRANPSARELAERAEAGVTSAARWAAPRAKAAAQATGRAVVRGARWAAPRAKAAAKATVAATRRGAKRAAPHVARGLRGAAERLDAFAHSNPCKGKCPPGKPCKPCCAHRLQASPMELEVVAHELEREMRGPHIPLPSELEFPHAEGDALCCAEHPVWRKVHEMAEGYREEGFTEEEVAAALQATPRLEAVYELEAHCVEALKRRARAKRPKGDVDALERASRRRKHLAAGGDTTGAEWRDTLKTRRRRNPTRWAWRSGPYQCGCRHTTPAAAEACARRNVAEGIVHLVAVS